MSWKNILKYDDNYTWDEAFSKFGFGDGRNKDLTDVVVKFIEGLGYEVGITSTGPHNDYIHLIINKDGENVYNKEDGLSKLSASLRAVLENKFKLGV